MDRLMGLLGCMLTCGSAYVGRMHHTRALGFGVQCLNCIYLHALPFLLRSWWFRFAYYLGDSISWKDSKDVACELGWLHVVEYVSPTAKLTWSTV